MKKLLLFISTILVFQISTFGQLTTQDLQVGKVVIKGVGIRSTNTSLSPSKDLYLDSLTKYYKTIFPNLLYTNSQLDLKANSSDVTTSLAGKVNTVTGFGLSSNDFTSTYKIRIDSNKTALSTKADLSYTNTQLGLKQNTLVSTTNIKTINSNNLLGSGNIAVGDAILANPNTFLGINNFQGKIKISTSADAPIIVKANGDGASGNLHAINLSHADSQGYIMHLTTNSAMTGGALLGVGIGDDGNTATGISGILVSNKSLGRGITLHQQSTTSGTDGSGFYGIMQGTGSPLMRLLAASPASQPLIRLEGGNNLPANTNMWEALGASIHGGVDGNTGELRWQKPIISNAKIIAHNSSITSTYKGNVELFVTGADPYMKFSRITGNGTTYYPSRIIQNANILKFQVATNAAPDSESWADAMSVFDNGNVGIGTNTNVGYRIDVNGPQRIIGNLIVYSGQIGVGTTTPATSAILDLSTNTKGFLTPRLTTTQRDAISSPAEGLEIYNLTTHTKDFYNGTVWKTITTN